MKKIISGEIPAEILQQDEFCLVIRDIDPQSPPIFSSSPKKVIPRIGNAQKEDQATLGHLLLVAAEVAEKEKLKQDIVSSSTMAVMEERPALTFMCMSCGRRMKWPPG